MDTNTISNLPVNFTLNQDSKNAISKNVGIPFDTLVSMDIEDIHSHIERKIGKRLKLTNFANDMRLIGRGSVYLSLGRIFNINKNKLNNYIDAIK
ncbi:MAG: hypothetical protein LBO69_02175 [Ignavibacteria bacterium]|jgi:NurA-like 5'-3' nuclease|nr:hypothetical protein [Ignavibacteria bacterium]